MIRMRSKHCESVLQHDGHRAAGRCRIVAAGRQGFGPAGSRQLPTGARRPPISSLTTSTQSSCELCGTGTVRIVVENPFRQSQDLDFSNIVVTEDLKDSGLTYVPNTTRFSGSNITVPANVEPTVGGPNGSTLTWTPTGAFTMDARPNGGASPATLIVEFNVRHAGPERGGPGPGRSRHRGGPRESPRAARPGERFVTTGGAGELALEQPVVRIDKRGRNLDAGQRGYSNTVYGHENDDVIWRIRVHNDGDAPLQDFEFTDSMTSGNFLIDYVCDREGHAAAAADGNPPSRCVDLGGVTS